MPKNIINITKTMIPLGSREVFIHSRRENEVHFKNFGILAAGISNLKPGYRIVREYCLDHILIYCTAGKGEVLNTEGQSKVFTKGDLIFIPGNAAQNYGSDYTFSMVWLHLKPNHKRLKFSNKKNLIMKPAYNNQLQNLFELFKVESTQIKNQNNRVLISVCECILAWIEREFQSTDPTNTTRHRRRIETLWLNVLEDLSYPWSVEKLSKFIHISSPHLYALTQQLYKMTPMGKVTQLRMDKAKMLLETTDLKLFEIASLVGYTSPFSLSRIFTKHFGISPKNLRNN